MARISSALVGLFLMLLPAFAPAAGRPPRVLVDKGGCPFECCRYEDWRTTRRIAGFAQARAGQLPRFWIPPGTRVEAVDGFVRSVGQPFRVTHSHGRYRAGDTLMVYTYEGEGVFRIWHAGRWSDEDLGFSPYGGSTGTRCSDTVHCWGTLTSEAKSEWWARLRMPAGTWVWVRADSGFEGQDSCG